jgi:hypothetical protein
MKGGAKEAVNAVVSTGVGAAAGAATYGIIGGVGLAVTGTAVGVTLGPFMAIGAGIGLTVYGIFWFGKHVGKKKE